LCNAPGDSLSDCFQLLSSKVLTGVVWIIGTASTLSNVIVLIYRLGQLSKSGFNMTVFFVLNLSIADLAMSVYLLFLAIADNMFNGVYAAKSSEWKGSLYCRIMGVLSFLSSEMSLFILLLMSLQRLITLRRKGFLIWLNPLFVATICVFGWTGFLILSIIPVIGFKYFGGENFVTSGSCLLFNFALGHQFGREYYLLISVCLNILFVFSLCTVCGGIIYLIVKSQNKLKEIGHVSGLGRRYKTYILLILLLASNLLCWLPMLALMSWSFLGGQVLPGISDWFAVIILPLNSLTNPILYTLRNIRFRSRSRLFKNGKTCDFLC